MWGVVGAAAAAVVACRVGFAPHPKLASPAGAPPPGALCPTALIGGGGDEPCPAAGCGLNGIWLGNGVPFRTLHVSPLRPNEAGLSLVAFRDAQGAALAPDIEDDVLKGLRGGTTLARADLRNARMLLTDTSKVCEEDFERFIGPGNLLTDRMSDRDPEANARALAVLSDIRQRSESAAGCGAGPHPPIYQITFVDVREQPFWATEAAARTSRLPHPTTPVYTFQASVVNAEGCDVQVCQPGLAAPAPDDPQGLRGSAVIFASDYYDDDYRVLPGPAHTTDYDAFNFACLGTTISKLHLLRHTVASRDSNATAPRPVPQRQAMMDVLTADYCGDGHPFTSDGVPLRLRFASPDLQLTAASGFPWQACGAGGCSVDAAWAAPPAGTDDAMRPGAACIDTPRRPPTVDGSGCAASSDGTRVICSAAGSVRCERPRCDAARMSASYVTSGNPQ